MAYKIVFSLFIAALAAVVIGITGLLYPYWNIVLREPLWTCIYVGLPTMAISSFVLAEITKD